jgi:hypothetical protein
MSGEIIFGDPDSYSFLFDTVREAREASRRYWAPDGPADRRYPVLPSPGWPEPSQAARSTVAAVEDIRERTRRRRR